MDELLSEASRQGIVVRPFDVRPLKQAVAAKLGVPANSNRPWDVEAAPTGIESSDGWSWPGEFVGAGSCVLIADDYCGTAYRLSSGSELNRLLSELPGFEFYVLDETAEWLLCFNHHDVVIGWGPAAAWISAKADA